MVNRTLRKSGGEWLVVSLFAVMLPLGGATTQGHWSDAIAQLASLALILLAAIRLMRFNSPASGLGPLFLAAIIVAVPTVQLWPLPPWIWSSLAGRSSIYEGFVQAGIDPPWLPLSLRPETTLRSCLSLAPPIAVFLSAAFLGPGTRRSMAFLVLMFAALNVVLGVAQVAGGPQSPLRFFETTNVNAAVGFFANRNHYSALSYSAAALLGAWSIGLARDRDEIRAVPLVLCLLLYVTLIFGVVSAGSRAGLSLMVLAGLGLGAMALREFGRLDSLVAARAGEVSRRLGKLLAVAASAAVLAAAVWSDALVQIVERIEPRVEIFRTTWTAASAYTPVGAGFGTFASIYQWFETPQQITPELINRAHNDWLELWLEGGLPSLAVVAVLSVSLLAASRRVWRDVGNGVDDFDQRLARASSIVVLLLAIHSLVDYPLRTTALACVFALACGNLVGWRNVAAVAGVGALDDRLVVRSAHRTAAR
ncbi:O-antigen ligase [Methylosinus sp. Sm6]|uniref:O-antigen ligase family protein n=1 Tax=Methylosinus sp. Sm6 TaxID=2866948 RepID=UPI001C99105D|nr:O-antigen ligase family protein [Methylosinus sp. Sm6]MBY6242462.1 hypothetical protein [Methylosinus sp. Sm6]